MAGQLHALTGDMMAGVTNEQLMRAKNMLKSFLVMGTEARMVAVEGETHVHYPILNRLTDRPE